MNGPTVAHSYDFDSFFKQNSFFFFLQVYLTIHLYLLLIYLFIVGFFFFLYFSLQQGCGVAV